VSAPTDEARWHYCQPIPQQSLPAKDDPATGVIQVDAAKLETSGDRALLFEGGVRLRQDGRRLSADHVKVYQQPQKIEAAGKIEASTRDFILQADSAVIEPGQHTSHYQQVQYKFIPRHAFGEARSIDQKDKVLTMKDASYSTCPPGKRDWVFTASKLQLDQALGFGYTTNALLRFKGVPLLYFPAATFPIDDRRRTGLLYPTIGRAKEIGTEFSQPFYWNIAPQMDMTLTPRYMSRRGVMLGDEFRYLGRRYEGELQLDYLNRDQVRKQDRYYYRLKHNYRPDRHWRIQLNGGVVSDGNYFSDFSGELSTTSTTHIERRADFIYGAQHVNGLIRAQAFQTVDATILPDDRPYRRLPQLTVEADLPWDNQHVNLSLATDFTRFLHDSLTDVTRFDIAPTLNLAWLTPGMWFKPTATWRFTRYDLDQPGERKRRTLSREVPTTSIDAGMVLERRTASNDAVQTLEPRLHYVDIPFRDQTDIPVLDSDEPAFIFSSLFRDNRFSGLDRVGDTRQLTAALSSRVLRDKDASERFAVSLGQIYYFRDRRVTLPGESPKTAHSSDLAAELSFQPNSHWTLRGSLIADNRFKRAQVATVRLHYQGKAQRVLNLEHRFHRDDDINQSNLSAVWPINQRWRFFGRWLISHESHDDLEIMAGLEYDSCCWKARLLNRRYVINDQGEYNSSLYIQLVLKGLASFGTGNTLLEKSIPGYVLDDN